MDNMSQRHLVPKLLVEPAIILLLNHELRTPLTAIKGFTALLMKYPQQFTQIEQREMLDEIIVGCARLEAVITQVVTVSERAAGMGSRMPEIIDLAQLVRQVVMTASLPAPLVTAAHWHYEVTIAPGTMLVVGNARELTRVLEHILKNGRQSSPTGGTIAMTLQSWHSYDVNASDEDSPPRWELQVHDSGMSQSAEQLQPISPAGAGADEDLTRGFAGQELGLLYCKLIVSLYGGQVWIDSPSQSGTTLHLLLPSVAMGDV